MKGLEGIKIEGVGYKLDMICIVVGIVMLDALIYILLELLLDGYSNYYGQGGGYFQNEDIIVKESLVLWAIYVWHTINLIGVSILVHQMIKIVSNLRKVSRGK